MSGGRQFESARPDDRVRIQFISTVGGRTPLARIAGWITYFVGAVAIGSRGRRPDLLYGSSPHLFAGLAGWVLARRWGVPFVLEVRDVWPQILVEMEAIQPTSLTYRALKRLERFLYRRADAVVHLASGLRTYLTEEDVDPARVRCIPNFGTEQEPRISRSESREQFGFHGTVAVYAGAHGRANGLHHLLRAAKELSPEWPALQIVLIGDGTQKDRLINLAADLELPNVRFLPPIPKDELIDLYAGADIGVHVLEDVELFRYGICPNKVMDYMAAALPVLTNSPGEVGDLVTSANSGVATEPGELAHGLRKMVEMDADVRWQLGHSGRDFVRKHRNPDLMAQRLSELLTELVHDID